MELIRKYFSQLSSIQIRQFSSIQKLYTDWNKKINVISRKDLDHLYERHVLHSLAIAKFISFKKGTRVLDVGTGGGFPGIPLAIYFPEVKFHLVDSVGKKIKVVQAVVEMLELKNVSAKTERAERTDGKYDFIVSRAVAPMKTLYDWTKHLIISKNTNEPVNGWILLKGGDLTEEIQQLRKEVRAIPVSDFFNEEFFKGKVIIYFR